MGILCVLVKVSVLTKAFVFLDNLCLQSMNDKIQKIRPQVKKKNTSCFSAFNQHTHFKLTFEQSQAFMFSGFFLENNLFPHVLVSFPCRLQFMQIGLTTEKCSSRF